MWDSMWELWALIALAAFAWFWYDSLRAREKAVAVGRAACERDGLQFLDDTVECVRIRAARDEYGSMALRRTYLFEFSDDGNSRRKASIVMLGARVESLTMEPFLLR